MAEQIYHSQHGEDALLLQVFDAPGYFAEIGAVDGLYLTNTLALEKAGWHGMLVEAHPLLFVELQANRPEAALCHAAVADKAGALTFYATQEGSLSTFDPDQRDYFIKNRSEVNANSYTEYPVRAATITQLLQEVGAPKVIDVMSIDIEGAELPALRGFDFEQYDARVLMVEKDDARAKQAIELEIAALLTSKGYKVARRLGPNDFWVKEPELAQKLTNAHVRATLQNGSTVDFPPGVSAKKRGFWKRISDSVKKRVG
ncbi:MAG: FkbM family methyltransferase [Pseudomonadota bacterium]